MSKRLNTQLHSMIVRNIVTAKFGEQYAEIEKELKKIKLRIGDRMATETEKKVKGFPLAFFRRGDSITVTIKGNTNSFPVSGYKGFQTIRGGYRDEDKKEVITFPELSAKDKDVVALEKVEAQEVAYREERQAFEAKVTSVVYGCTTVNKLLEVWPESAKFIPAEAGMNALIPAGTVEDLNKSLGL